MLFGLDKLRKTYLSGWTFSLLCLIGMASCQKPVNERRVFLCKWHLSYEDSLQFPNHVRDASGKGTYYSRTNVKNEYSDGISFPIPDSLLGRDLRIKISCQFRKGPGHGEALLVAQVVQEEQNFFYNAFYLPDYGPRENTWVKMEDSTQVNLQVNKPAEKKLTLKVYLWNREDFNVDLDDLDVELFQIVSEEQTKS